MLSNLREKLKSTSKLIDKKIKEIFHISPTLNKEDLEQLEDLLIESDLGIETAMRLVTSVEQQLKGKSIDEASVRNALRNEISLILQSISVPMPLFSQHPQVIIFVGVNGSGKTTTIGKLACQLKASGKHVMIAAADTFRAAAVEQLQIWGQRSGTPVFSIKEEKDPASLVFSSIQTAIQEKADILMIDTAGRLANRKDLMDELNKIIRTIKKCIPSAPHNTILVLDANAGQNAVEQVEMFREVANISGIMMTKLDGTAKGGILITIAGKFGIPIHAIGTGEKIEDLQPFSPDDFAKSIIT